MPRTHLDFRPEDDDACSAACDRILRAIEGQDADAVEMLWNRLQLPLEQLFRRLFGMLPHPVVGEEDLASEVIMSLYLEIRNGRLRDIHSWPGLWRFARVSAFHKFLDQRRRDNSERRVGRRRERGRAFAAETLAVDMQAGEEGYELYESFWSVLEMPRDDRVWTIVMLIASQQYSKKQIADRLHISVRTVNRELAILYRRWVTHNKRGRQDARRELIVDSIAK